MSRININNYEAFLLDYLEGSLDVSGIETLRAFALTHPELGIELEETELPYLPSEKHERMDKSMLKKSEYPLADEELIAYLENQLAPAQKALFEKKLNANPEVVALLAAYQKTKLRPDSSEVFGPRHLLLRGEDELVLNNQLIALLEEQLNGEEKARLEKELKTSPALRAELALYQRSRLVADAGIVYPDKRALKKEGRVLTLFSYRSMAAVAAALLFLLGLFGVLKYDNPTVTAPVKMLSQADTKKPAEHTVSVPHAGALVDPPFPLQKAPAVRANGVRSGGDRSQASSRSNATEGLVSPGAAVQDRQIAQVDTLPLWNNSENNTLAQNQPHPAGVSAVDSSALAFLAPDFLGEQMKPLTELNVVEDFEDDAATVTKKENFWKRAVKFAQKANALGAKNIEGEETGKSGYFLSFNSFSVEKK